MCVSFPQNSITSLTQTQVVFHSSSIFISPSFLLSLYIFDSQDYCWHALFSNFSKFQKMTEPKRRSYPFSLAARLGVVPFTRKNFLLWQELTKLKHNERDVTQNEKNFQDRDYFYNVGSPDPEVVAYRTVNYPAASLGAQLIVLSQQTGVKNGTFRIKLIEYDDKSGEFSASPSMASSPLPEDASLHCNFIESGITIESGGLFSGTSVLPSADILASSYSQVLDILGIRPIFEQAIMYYTNPEYQDGDAPPGIEHPCILRQYKDKDTKPHFHVVDPDAPGNANIHSSYEILCELELHFYRPDELKLNYELQKKLAKSRKLAERASNPWIHVIDLLNELQVLRDSQFKKYGVETGLHGHLIIQNYNGKPIPLPRVPFQMVITGLAKQGKSSFVWLTQITQKGVFSLPGEGLFVHDEFGCCIGTKFERAFTFTPQADIDSKYQETMRFTMNDLPGIKQNIENGEIGRQENLQVHQHALIIIEASELFEKDKSVRKDFRDQYQKIKFHEHPVIILVTKWDLLFYDQEVSSADELVARLNSVWEHPKRLEIDICIEKFQAFSGIFCPIIPVELPVMNEKMTEARFRRLMSQTRIIWLLYLSCVLQDVERRFHLAN